jgi:hypothetical protein
MAFPPQFLPQRSWQKLVETLADHFGENASLGEAERKAVLDYLLAHAADGPQAGRAGRKFGQGIAAGQTPLRITETPWWMQDVSTGSGQAGHGPWVLGAARRLLRSMLTRPSRGISGHIPPSGQRGRR